MNAAVIDNAPFHSRSLGGMTLQGYSRAGIQSYWRIPELRVGFDLALLPWSFTDTSPWFVTHAHLDHFLALPTLLARRRMMGLVPPTVYVPEVILDDVRNLMAAWERLDRGPQKCDLRGLNVGGEIELPSKHVVKVFPTTHTVPSLGYAILEPRKKLKPEFQHLAGEAIRDLKAKGVEVIDEVRFPLFAYTGDTSDAVFEANPFLFHCKTLLIEMSFLQDSPSPPTAHRHGHLHLQDFLDRHELFENELILAAHFSSRYAAQEVKETLASRLPERLRNRIVAWVDAETFGFA